MPRACVFVLASESVAGHDVGASRSKFPHPVTTTHTHACPGLRVLGDKKKRERQFISFLPSRIGRTCSFFAQTSQPCRRDASFAPARWDAHEQVLSEPANSGSLSLSLRSHPVPTIQSTMTRCLRLVGTASRNTKHG